MTERALERLIALVFAVAGLAGILLLGLYALGGQTQLEAILLATALGGIGVGIVLWAQRLLPNEVEVHERHSLATPPEQASGARGGVGTPEASTASPRPAEMAISRRTLLIRALAGAFAGLAAALAIPVFSLGPAPTSARRGTSWRAGMHLVGVDGKPVKAADIPVQGIATVFPEGLPGDADSQTVLIRVDPAQLQLSGDRAAGAPQGYVAYSKICTHAGCPVGLYRAEQHVLLCPCHQSTFDVLDGAKPTYGPAARPLPQLPIRLDPDGTLVALGDFPDPVGPSYWNITDG